MAVYPTMVAIALMFSLHALEHNGFDADIAPLDRVRLTCKQVSSCTEAVMIWCNGYRRADGDNDGIPCENVCSSREQVEEIRRSIGC